MVEQLPEGDAVGSIAVGGQQRDGLRREPRPDRIVEPELSLLDESQRGDGDERLGDARDAERRVGRERERGCGSASPAAACTSSPGRSTAAASPGTAGCCSMFCSSARCSVRVDAPLFSTTLAPAPGANVGRNGVGRAARGQDDGERDAGDERARRGSGHRDGSSRRRTALTGTPSRCWKRPVSGGWRPRRRGSRPRRGGRRRGRTGGRPSRRAGRSPSSRSARRSRTTSRRTVSDRRAKVARQRR